MSENSVEQVRERAYTIWKREGQPEGRELEHWLQAEQELAQESADDGRINDSQIDAIEITEEREHLRDMEEKAKSRDRERGEPAFATEKGSVG